MKIYTNPEILVSGNDELEEFLERLPDVAEEVVEEIEIVEEIEEEIIEEPAQVVPVQYIEVASVEGKATPQIKLGYKLFKENGKGELIPLTVITLEFRWDKLKEATLQEHEKTIATLLEVESVRFFRHRMYKNHTNKPPYLEVILMKVGFLNLLEAKPYYKKLAGVLYKKGNSSV